MKTRHTRIIVSAVVAVGAVGWMLFGQTGVGAPQEETIKVLETSRAQALLKADTKALGDMVADDFVEISRLGQLRSKADNIRDITSGDLKLTSVAAVARPCFAFPYAFPFLFPIAKQGRLLHL